MASWEGTCHWRKGDGIFLGLKVQGGIMRGAFIGALACKYGASPPGEKENVLERRREGRSK